MTPSLLLIDKVGKQRHKKGEVLLLLLCLEPVRSWEQLGFDLGGARSPEGSRRIWLPEHREMQEVTQVCWKALKEQAGRLEKQNFQ